MPAESGAAGAPGAPTDARRRVLVLGAGVTGLTAAVRLHQRRPDLDVVVLEERPRAGGNIVTRHEQGFVIDGGPDSFLRTKPQAVALCRDLGLGEALIEPLPTAKRVWVVHHGRLTPLPTGMALSVPTRVGPLALTPLLSPRGKARAALEPFLPRGTAGDESIAAFFERRLGRELSERLAGPLLGGIYAGDVRELSLAATFPQLVELEQRHGSLLAGFLAMAAARGGVQLPAGDGPRQRLRRWAALARWLARGPEEAPSPFLSLREGMGSLIERLVAALPAGAVRLGQPVTRLASPPGGGFVAETPAGPVHAAAVVLALPAAAAARLLPEVAGAAELGGVPTVSTATVFFGLRRADVDHPLDGSGFVVPRGEGRLLAGTFITGKWPHRAPAGHVALRAFLGGHRDPELVRGASDEELARVARAELARLIGRVGDPLVTSVARYPDANPQPVVGHRERLARVRARLAARPGLALAGAAYDGVGIPDCVRQAEEAVAAVLAVMPPPDDRANPAALSGVV